VPGGRVLFGGLDFALAPSEFVAIMGESGAGKSTLLNLIAGLDTADSGSIAIRGTVLEGLDDDARTKLRRESIGFVFQAFHLIGHRSVLENVMLSDVYRKYPRRERNERARSALGQVGLSRRADYLPTRLSGGERQRAAIARATMGSPRVLLCDEPTGNLDSGTTASILDVFAELNRSGLTIVTITHEADVAQRASRKLRIVDGRIEDPQ